MSSRKATATSPRKVRSWRTASVVRAKLEKREIKHASGARLIQAEPVGRVEKNRHTCTEVVEHPCPSISIAIQSP